MTTNDAFIRQKLANFCDFINACLGKRISHARCIEFGQKLDTLRHIESGQFILYITADIVPYKNNPDALFAKLLAEVPDAELTDEERKKLIRYGELFISIVEQHL